MIHKLKMNVELVTDPNQWAWNNFWYIIVHSNSQVNMQSQTWIIYIWLIYIMHIRGGPFLVQKSVWRSSEARDWFASQTQFWCRALLRFCTKSAHSNHSKRTKIVNWHVITPFLFDVAVLVHFSLRNQWSRVKLQFWCVLNGSNEHFWCIIEEMLCTKIAFAKQIQLL